MGFCNCSMFCCKFLYVPSSFAIILMRKRELVALLSLSSWCLVIVVWYLAVPWVSLQFVTVVFLDHTHLLFLMCLAQGHNAMTPVRLKLATPWSLVKHSTTEPLHSQYICTCIILINIYFLHCFTCLKFAYVFWIVHVSVIYHNLSAEASFILFAL